MTRRPWSGSSRVGSISADPPAVLIMWGYTDRVEFIEGATVFLKPIGGALVEMTMSGQRFTFAPR